MTDPVTPSPETQASPFNLKRASLLAAGAAALVLVTAVLPAEYGIDPTGIGGVLGLTQLGDAKRAQAGSGAETGDIIEKTADGGTHVRIMLRPYGGREVKGLVKAGGEMRYDWTANGVDVEFEFHGEPKIRQGDEFQSYEKGTKGSAKGTLKVPFEGKHGWYWKNLTPQTIAVDATVNAAVEQFGPLDEDETKGAEH